MRTEFSVCDLIPARHDVIGLCANVLAGAHAAAHSTGHATILPRLTTCARACPHRFYWPPDSFGFRNGVSRSMGKGKTTVLLFSAATSVSACR